MRYVPRLVDEQLATVLAAFPAALLLGPRACGKTTSAKRLAGVVVQLDDPQQAGAFRADPTSALVAAMRRRAGAPLGPVVLDEWQEVPEVLGAVKRLVDAGAAPGSFLLTGSVRAALGSASWPGTGRVIHVDMYPMTTLEVRAEAQPRGAFVASVFDGDPVALPLPADLPDLAGYVDLAVRGGYPPVLGLDEQERRIWGESYVEQLVLRDVPDLGETRDPTAVRRILRAVVENTAGLTADTAIAVAADVNVKTARRTERLLDDLRVITSLPAWHSNRLSRLVKGRKRYAVDGGLAAAVLGIDEAAVMANSDLLGRLLDTFVNAQLRPLLSGPGTGIAAYHLRHQDGRREVDVILERSDGRICGLEIKATASPGRSDARHLAWLRDELGDRFVRGVVLHTGQWSYPLDDRITALPIGALWADSE